MQNSMLGFLGCWFLADRHDTNVCHVKKLLGYGLPQRSNDWYPLISLVLTTGIKPWMTSPSMRRCSGGTNRVHTHGFGHSYDDTGAQYRSLYYELKSAFWCRLKTIGYKIDKRREGYVALGALTPDRATIELEARLGFLVLEQTSAPAREMWEDAVEQTTIDKMDYMLQRIQDKFSGT